MTYTTFTTKQNERYNYIQLSQNKMTDTTVTQQKHIQLYTTFTTNIMTYTTFTTIKQTNIYNHMQLSHTHTHKHIQMAAE